MFELESEEPRRRVHESELGNKWLAMRNEPRKMNEKEEEFEANVISCCRMQKHWRTAPPRRMQYCSARLHSFLVRAIFLVNAIAYHLVLLKLFIQRKLCDARSTHIFSTSIGQF